jgi:hypothetical protein
VDLVGSDHQARIEADLPAQQLQASLTIGRLQRRPGEVARGQRGEAVLEAGVVEHLAAEDGGGLGGRAHGPNCRAAHRQPPTNQGRGSGPNRRRAAT